MSDQIIFKVNLYVYNGNSEQVKSCQIHTELNQTNNNTFYILIIITVEAINQLSFSITFHDLGCPFKTFCFVILIFHFQKCRDPNP